MRVNSCFRSSFRQIRNPAAPVPRIVLILAAALSTGLTASDSVCAPAESFSAGDTASPVYPGSIAPAKAHLESKLGGLNPALTNLAIPFEANVGQLERNVAFQAQTFAGGVFVTRNGEIVHAG
jgi:hypothetical protein